MKINKNSYFSILIFLFVADDERRLQEELQDLIDDNPVEEDSGGESDTSRKRKKSDDELDDRFEDEDYDLIEENLGVKVERVSYFRRGKFTPASRVHLMLQYLFVVSDIGLLLNR